MIVIFCGVHSCKQRIFTSLYPIHSLVRSPIISQLWFAFVVLCAHTDTQETTTVRWWCGGALCLITVMMITHIIIIIIVAPRSVFSLTCEEKIQILRNRTIRMFYSWKAHTKDAQAEPPESHSLTLNHHILLRYRFFVPCCCYCE